MAYNSNIIIKTEIEKATDNSFDGFDQESELAYQKITRSEQGKTYAWLVGFFVAGCFLTSPIPSIGKGAWPEFSFLIIFPIIVTILCKLYVKHVIKGFSLVKRLHPDVAIEQDAVKVNFEMKYKSFIPFSLAYYSEYFRASRSFGSPLTILANKDFKKGGIGKFKYTIVCNRGFGTYEVGPLELTVTDPFHLFKEKTEFKPTSHITIWLNPPPEEDVTLINTMVLSPTGTTSSGKAGNGMDFYGLKEYAPGDDIKAISWTKSAAIGKTVIKQFEKDATPNIFVCLHTDRSEIRGLGSNNTLKRIFRIAAATIQGGKEKGLQVKLAMTQGMGVTITDIGSEVPVYGFMTELLGNLQAAEKEAMEALMNELCYQTGPGSTVMLLSHTLALDYDMLSNAMTVLKSKGCKLVIWIIDDSKQIRFNTWGDKVTPQQFAESASAMGVMFRIIDPREQRYKEEAFIESGKALGV